MGDEHKVSGPDKGGLGSSAMWDRSVEYRNSDTLRNWCRVLPLRAGLGAGMAASTGLGLEHSVTDCQRQVMGEAQEAGVQVRVNGL